MFSNVPVKTGDTFTRPSAGGGGFGDPLERDPALVAEDVTDGYAGLNALQWVNTPNLTASYVILKPFD